MGSRGRVLFDLNELPSEEEDENKVVVSQPQKSLPVSINCDTSSFLLPAGSQGILNNNAFKHASSCSVFQPFVRNKECSGNDDCADTGVVASTGGNCCEDASATQPVLESENMKVLEREEGEWSDADGTSNAEGSGGSNYDKYDTTFASASANNSEGEYVNRCHAQRENSDTELLDASGDSKVHSSCGLESTKTVNCSVRGNSAGDDTGSSLKAKDVKGVEASFALKVASNLGKKPKLDEHKEAMLGKKRARQTVFINVEDAKQASSMKTPTPRRHAPTFPNIRSAKEASRGVAERSSDKQNQQLTKEQKLSEMDIDANKLAESSEHNGEINGYMELGSHPRPKKMNIDESSVDGYAPPISRQGSWKLSGDSKTLRNSQSFSRKSNLSIHSVTEQKLGSKKFTSLKKQGSNSTQYQDTSVERLIREVTNEKFWSHPDDADLECVPGRFESAEEYIRVFEPLLFEECRAQLYSSYVELTESVSRDAHITVRVRMLEKRERGWFDVILLPSHDNKWFFKEGEVAVLSSTKPGSAVLSGRSGWRTSSTDEGVQKETDFARLVGTVRRYIPTDTRDPIGAVIHFHVGESYDFNGKSDEDNILKKLQPKSVWYLTSLGSLATTTREYVALHAFRRLSLQMQTAILQPSPELFPNYDAQTLAMPDCFTQRFAEHLHCSFNGPQLSAIQWAAMHTAAGSNNGVQKRQEPWPFTLVQGPPGTGKTHTVWGMLNVIHLVQYQRYYAALLKKLAPESCMDFRTSTPDPVGTGSIDEVLQSMDQNLLRTLPKLCPKPRMLVCAPSNAATDELLARVLDRGFIDGEMRVYRPDVARVGVDSQSRAAQAVSVERRTEQLLGKSREEVVAWLHQLKAREQQESQKMIFLQRELNIVAAAGRSQGTVGVDPDDLAARDRNRDKLLQDLAAVVESRDKILVEMQRLLIVESRFRPGSNFNLEDIRSNLEASFANEAEIVFTTVSSSGRKLFSRLTQGFDMVVIDEAAQASEVGVLPPLSLGAARCVLVGDPQQLPATVISKAAGTLLYSRSLFERFQQAGCPTILLSVQYRMHPQIRDFPSRFFYQGRLTDSESVANLPDEAYYSDPLLKPYVFYDVVHGRESHRGGSASFQNVHEAQFCVSLYEHLQKFLKDSSGKKVSVGIITPYKLQLKCLQREFEEVIKAEEGRDIYINTVDAFQGQERDVIIMSCVRASNHGVGFVADIRRMNVALTRARRALWIVGNANALMQSEDWAALIADAKTRKCFMDMDSIPKEFVNAKGSSSNVPAKSSSGSVRNFRTGGQRPRQFDAPPEVKHNIKVDDADKWAGAVLRNGSYRNLDDIGYSGDRPRDAFPNGMARRNNINAPRREV